MRTFRVWFKQARNGIMCICWFAFIQPFLPRTEGGIRVAMHKRRSQVKASEVLDLDLVILNKNIYVLGDSNANQLKFNILGPIVKD